MSIVHGTHVHQDGAASARDEACMFTQVRSFTSLRCHKLQIGPCRIVCALKSIHIGDETSRWHLERAGTVEPSGPAKNTEIRRNQSGLTKSFCFRETRFAGGLIAFAMRQAESGFSIGLICRKWALAKGLATTGRRRRATWWYASCSGCVSFEGGGAMPVRCQSMTLVCGCAPSLIQSRLQNVRGRSFFRTRPRSEVPNRCISRSRSSS